MKSKIILFVLAAAFTFPVGLKAQTPNFSEHIAPVIYYKCGSCHRQGEIAPMPLTSYQEVKAYGQSIRFATKTGYMPPWKADASYQHYLNQNVLTDWEKTQIQQWVDAGMPQGDPKKEPPFPSFPEGSQLGTPDLVLSMAKAYQHAGNGKDNYRIFVLPTNLPEDREIAAIEFRAGNKLICHHAIIGLDTTGQGRALDAKDTEYGYEGFGGFGFNVANSFVGGWVPGFNPPFYPDGFGKKLYKNSDLLVQMHYAPYNIPQMDSSTINIFFTQKKSGNRIIETTMVTPTVLTNGPFIIPADSVKEFHGQINIPQVINLSLYSVLPHSHLLGKNWWVYAVKPGGDTLPIVKIPQWDFHWQMEYIFPKFMKIPGGSVIHMHARYDNTASNPENPNDPPKRVTFGESTYDEMFIVFFSLTNYQPGDENTPLSIKPLPAVINTPLLLYPNPTNGKLTIQSYGSAVTYKLYNLSGSLLQQGSEENTTLILDITHLPKGMYLLETQTGDVIKRSKVVKE